MRFVKSVVCLTETRSNRRQELLRETVDVAVCETVPGGHRVKINNSFTAPMTRYVEKVAPDLVGFFRTRS